MNDLKDNITLIDLFKTTMYKSYLKILLENLYMIYQKI